MKTYLNAQNILHILKAKCFHILLENSNSIIIQAIKDNLNTYYSDKIITLSAKIIFNTFWFIG